ncbi:MAG TPA: TonB family protein [Steroidobacteraceae bacterium]|nr:TonB family protein [Steroidobacteraceae bacterium]
MDMRRSALLACAALMAVLVAPARAAPPAGAELREASVAVGYEPQERCPGLIQTDIQEPSAALVVLVVGPSGVPSQPSIKSSSGSESLDAAALSCVMKLRFLPAVRAGEGSAMASWQEAAWKWGREHFAPTAPAAGAAPRAPAGGAAAAPPAALRAPAGGAEVRVCADETGKLTQDPVITRSSGDSGLDEAALAIARSGAPYYRPAGAAPVTGCAQLAIKFEAK